MPGAARPERCYAGCQAGPCGSRLARAVEESWFYFQQTCFVYSNLFPPPFGGSNLRLKKNKTKQNQRKPDTVFQSCLKCCTHGSCDEHHRKPGNESGTFCCLRGLKAIVFCSSETLKTGIMGISLISLVAKIREHYLASLQGTSFSWSLLLPLSLLSAPFPFFPEVLLISHLGEHFHPTPCDH